MPVVDGHADPDAETALLDAGTYYWLVTYEGDGANQPSVSPCPSQILTVRPPLTIPRNPVISRQIATLRIGCTLVPCRLAIAITLPAGLQADVARHTGERKAPAITLARGTVTIRKHGPQTVRLRLAAAGRRFVASHNGQVRVNVAIAVTIHGHTTRVRRSLKIKIMKPSNRR